MWRQHVLLWPASAMLTGNGVAFVLRVPGTAHGDWWSMRGWWIFAGTAAFSLLSKHIISFRGNHIFNPSNIGLVVCFLLLPVTKAEPLDFWWGPMSVWLVLALVVILAGGFTILSRLSLLRVALSFWATFAVGIAILAAAGHQMTARWHLGPIGGFSFWWLLVTSPEILVFLFFMITDPKTAPRGPRARVVYAVSIGIVATLLIAPMRTEYWSKVALLSALVVVCLGQTVLAVLPRPLPRLSRRALVLAGAAGLAAYAAALVVISPSPIATAALPATERQHPPAADHDPALDGGLDAARLRDRERDRARPRHRPRPAGAGAPAAQPGARLAGGGEHDAGQPAPPDLGRGDQAGRGPALPHRPAEPRAQAGAGPGAPDRRRAGRGTGPAGRLSRPPGDGGATRAHRPPSPTPSSSSRAAAGSCSWARPRRTRRV